MLDGAVTATLDADENWWCEEYGPVTGECEERKDWPYEKAPNVCKRPVSLLAGLVSG